jgi:hypothetical protein
MMDAMTYEMVQRKNIGWMSEAHRLSLGANRARKRPAVSGNASHLSYIAVATSPHAKIARDLIMQPVAPAGYHSGRKPGLHDSRSTGGKFIFL